MNFTTPQAEAIGTTSLNALVVAGPGSGKTSTLTARIEAILEAGFDPKAIAVLSFTNAAANELARRLTKEVPKGTVLAHPVGPEVNGISREGVQLGFLGTLHSFALHCLKRHGEPFGYGRRTAIISPESAEDLMASKATSLGCNVPLKKLLEAKARDGRPPRGKRLSLVETVIATYLDELREARVVDYDVLLQEFREMLTSTDPNALSAQQEIERAFSHLFVDEVQDSAAIDWDIYRALPIGTKFYVGDPDQNLYEFRGARVREMVREAGDSRTAVFKLEENFRSDVAICAAAQRLVANNRTRVDKETRPVSEDPGSVVLLGEFENEGEEIAVVSREIKALGYEPARLKEIAVLARTNAIAEGFRRTLPNAEIPVVGLKHHELPRDWALARSYVELLLDPDNDALAYFYLVSKLTLSGRGPAAARREAQRMRVEANAADLSINARFLNRMEPVALPSTALTALSRAGTSREAQMIAVEKWRELPPGAGMDDFALALASVYDYSKEEEGDGVHVLTMHGAKGREWDAVFLVGMEDETIPGRADDADAIEAERRVAYVALTRARHAAFLSSVKSRVTPWKQVVARRPSRFLKEILP
jgi:DNA helicase-2/ATP-dependent DNA helicase PcrA